MKVIGYTILTMLTGGLAIPAILISESNKKKVIKDKDGNEYVIYKGKK